MGIQNKESLIAEIEQFKEEALKTYIVERWAESYTNTDPFGHVIFENENNKVWWMKAQAHQLWCFWKAAKAQVPEGFVLMPKEPTEETLTNMTNAPIVVNHLCDNADIFLSEDEARIAYKAAIKAQEQNG